jgi:hypothetical protein
MAKHHSSNDDKTPTQRIADYCREQIKNNVDFNESQEPYHRRNINALLNSGLGLDPAESDSLAIDIVRSVRKELNSEITATASVWSDLKARFSKGEAIKRDVIKELQEPKREFFARKAEQMKQEAEVQKRGVEFIDDEVWSPQPVVIGGRSQRTENLMDSASSGNLEGVKAALARGEDINTRDADGKTPLALVIEKICIGNPHDIETIQLENVMKELASHQDVDLSAADDAVLQMIQGRKERAIRAQGSIASAIADRPINAYLSSAESNPDVVKHYVACFCFCANEGLKNATPEEVNGVVSNISAALQKHPDLKGKDKETEALAHYMIGRVEKELSRNGDRSLISKMCNYIDAKIAKISPERFMKRQIKKAARKMVERMENKTTQSSTSIIATSPNTTHAVSKAHNLQGR